MTEMTQEEINRTLLKEIQRLKDLHAVQEIMSRYFHLHAAGLHKKVYDTFFAKKQPDVSADVANLGRWEGPEAVKSLFYEHLPAIEGDRVGQMYIHCIDTPALQIAGDGKTAKGVWFSPGHETVKVDGELKAVWCWSYYAADFIREDGEWKIWHYHCYAMVKTPFEQSWVDKEGEAVPILPDLPGQPNKPYTYFNEYTTTSVRELVPAPPEPYETFDPSKAY